MSGTERAVLHWDVCVLIGPHFNLRGVWMSDANFLLLATCWRTRAEEILAQAEVVTDADARQEMREAAAAYEDLAAQLETEFHRN